jgi:4-carboxymuconolactone decarboxylase
MAALRKEIAAALRARVRPARIDEALLQVMPFAGFARTINALAVLRESVPRPASPRGTRRGIRGRGARLCRRIYGPVYGRLVRRMTGLHPALADWIRDIGYGQVLSRPVLGAREREVLAVAVLASTPGVGPQLESHVRGAIRLGASAADLRKVLKGCGLSDYSLRDSRRDSPARGSRVPR